MSFDPEFPGLLAAISKIYTGEKLFWLRLLLYGHCSGDLLSKPKITGHDLFNQLKARGYISYDPNDASRTDVEMLVDIAEVTKETRALQIIQKFKQKHKNKNSNYNFTKGKPISEYRKNLFKALDSNTTDLLSEMPGHYDLNPADFSNKWDLVFKLEGSKALEEGNVKKMEHFAMILDEDAKQIFLQTQNGARKRSTRTKGKASASKETRKRQRSTTSEKTDNDGIRKRKKSTTSEESDVDDNSDAEESEESTLKQKRTRVSTLTRACQKNTRKGSGSKNKSETKSKKKMKQIMISYKTTYQVTVKKIVKRLEEKLKETHTIWIDYRDINDDIMKDIEKGIKESDIALICLSKKYETDLYCKEECQLIQDNDIPFIPLMLEKYKPEDTNSNVQQLIKGKHKENFTKVTNSTEKNYDKLVKRIKEIEKQ